MRIIVVVMVVPMMMMMMTMMMLAIGKMVREKGRHVWNYVGIETRWEFCRKTSLPPTN